MTVQNRTPGSSRTPATARNALVGMLLAGIVCATAFVALINAPMPEELVLASLGHEATTGAIGRAATP